MSWWSSPSLNRTAMMLGKKHPSRPAETHLPLNVPGHNDVAIGRYQGTGYRTHQGGRPEL